MKPRIFKIRLEKKNVLVTVVIKVRESQENVKYMATGWGNFPPKREKQHSGLVSER